MEMQTINLYTAVKVKGQALDTIEKALKKLGEAKIKVVSQIFTVQALCGVTEDFMQQ